ncbi:hypothetical protein QYE76_018924 [Lolium multiflorum]|uniref:GRF-type domain-containing protein n=1 Tax=Lolium multiflorum TaxID=4521 RepID=A0AAD8VDH5_LOLMU|nr:hypothetical protein QYE76_018924 [Lolium multiflorum]
MVSWGDGEESSDYQSSDSDNDALNTIYDSEYCGSDDGLPAARCKCRKVAGRFVAFEGWQTGRRFLGCDVQEGRRCDYMKWIDGEWPMNLKKALGKLWEMYGAQKHGRTSDALDHFEQKFKLHDEISKLHKDLKMAQDELKTVIGEKQMTLALKAKAEQALIDARAELDQKKLIDAHHSNMHKVLRIRAEKERDQMKQERDLMKKERDEVKADKRKLEFIIGDFLKQKEEHRSKMKKIIQIALE